VLVWDITAGYLDITLSLLQTLNLKSALTKLTHTHRHTQTHTHTHTHILSHTCLECQWPMWSLGLTGCTVVVGKNQLIDKICKCKTFLGRKKRIDWYPLNVISTDVIIHFLWSDYTVTPLIGFTEWLVLICQVVDYINCLTKS